MLYLYVIFLLLMNLLGLFSMRIDKNRAIRRKRRIPEKVLFCIALFGGCFGSYLGMRIYHHKTRHNLFAFGLPILMPIHVYIAAHTFISLM